MLHRISIRFCSLAAAVVLALAATSPAQAETNAQLVQKMELMQQQMQQMQAQLNDLKQQLAKQTSPQEAQTAPAASPVVAAPRAALVVTAAPTPAPEAQPASGVTVTNKNNIRLTLGGYAEAAGIWRMRNETADIGSNWNTGMPLPISPNYHMTEFRGSARQSRLSLLAQGSPDATTDLSAYFEGDFLGAAPTANSAESNSYNPRLRQAFAALDKKDDDFHLVAGQAWSLITLNKKGIAARGENVPLTIDAQYVPGFTWTRQPQLRFVKGFDSDKVTAGLSLESPQALLGGGPNTPAGTPTFTNPGGSGFASTSNYSTDVAPDIVAKLALDPGWGHYELYGLARFFRDRHSKENSTITGGGIGGGMILPLIEKKLEFQLSGLAGSGVGRYGSAQLPDVTFRPDGSLAAIREVEALAGLVGHPTDDWDLYLYGGTERSQREAFTSGLLGFGYGSPLYNNSGCDTEGAAAATCVANTSSSSQVAIGAWWKFYHGNYGLMQTGIENSYTRRNTFSGIGGAPHTDEDVVMMSLRYYPF